MTADATPQQTWVVHPLRENWTRSVLLSIFLTLVLAGVYWSFNLFLTVLAAIFLIGSLYGYFVPVRYTFYEAEIVITSLFYRSVKSWSAFHSFYVDRNGVLLSPFAKPSRLENFRGTYVRFGTNRENVLAFIERKMSDCQ